MTGETKSNVLKYLVGDMPQQTGVNEPQFINDKTLNNNIKTDIKARLKAMGYSNILSTPVLGKIYDENNSNWLIYGYFVYLNSSLANEYNGFIYICDNNLNFKSLLTKYDSGTNLQPIASLNKDENNNYYGLDTTISGTVVSRVILLNNIIGSGAKDGNYYCKLRKSYILPSSIRTTFAFFRQNRIVKVPNESIYFITCNDSNQSSVTTVIRFTINVESGNIWDILRLPTRIDSIIFDVKIKKTNDIEFYIYGIDLNNIYREYSIIGENITQIKQISLSGQFSAFATQILVYDDNNIYLIYADTNTKITYLKKLNGNSFSNIKSWNWIQVGESYYNPIITLENVNNILFLRSAITNAQIITSLTVAILKDTTLYEHNLGSTTNYAYSDIYEYNEFYINNSYNLFNIIVPKSSAELSSYKTQLVYNEVNYNGQKYLNKNSIIPRSGIIENEDKSEVLFARNIYNKTVNANTTTTTIEIPNTLLNDIPIINKSLLSETNTIINENDEDITTNIYETLYLNYINTINIQNQNDIDNIIVNQNGSNRLNNSSTNLLDYDNAKATKIRYNYTDGTSVIGTPVIRLINNTKYRYEITITLTKLINSIDIMSADGNTIYQTMDLRNLEVGKTYNIKQDVRIEDVPVISENLLYNNEQVLYSGQEVLIGG